MLLQDSIADRRLPFKGVADDLLGQIEAGSLRPGDKLQSTAKLAAHYDVAVPTAHRALADLAKRGFLTRKAGVGTFVREAAVSARREGVGIVVRCDGHIWGEFADSLLRHLGQRRSPTTTVNVTDLTVEQILRQPAFEHLLECCPETVIVQDTRVGERILAHVPDAHVITLSTSAGRRGLDQVVPDLELAGAMAVQHLVERGHERVDLAGIFISEAGPYRPSPDTQSIRAGMDDALALAGLPAAGMVDIPASEDASDRLREYLLSPDRATALVCNMAHRAAQIVRLAREVGVAIPGDLALVSTTDTPWTEAYGITSLDNRYGQIADLCIELMDDRAAAGPDAVRHRRSYRVAPLLVEREST